MNTSRLFVGFAATHILAVAAFAQQPPTSESSAPGTPQPAASVKATPEQKIDGKASRKREGRTAARSPVPGEGNPVPAQTGKVAKADRQEARAQRKSETARANKAGEITAKGEVGASK